MNKEDLINVVLVKAEDSLKAATILFEQNIYGSSISESYYAMYYLAQACLYSVEINYKTHAAVISAFSKNFVKEGLISTLSGRRLSKALEERIRSDYEFTHKPSKEKAKELLIYASELSVEVNNLLKI